jgi:hypothetical protein
MIIGTNWFLGYSHTSAAKDRFITSFQTPKKIADILEIFLDNGIDTLMGMPTPVLQEAIQIAEDRTGKKIIRIFTPGFNVLPGGPAESEPERVFDYCKELGATFCFPHTSTTDLLVDRMYGVIRDIDRYTGMIRARGMIPGLSTHLPESVTIADKTGADVESYVQIYNAIGFLMPLEVDWEMRVIKNAKKPVMTIKSMAAGRLLPPVGLAFSWNTIRDQDMVIVGTTTPDEAREVIELSFDFLSQRMPSNQLQWTRSKKTLA